MGKTPITFTEAANHLEMICQLVDNSEDAIEDLLADVFNKAQLELSDSVDRRIRYIKYAESQISLAKEMRTKWAERAQRLESVVERLKTRTIEAMKANPNIPYKGELGSFKVMKNSIPSVSINDPGRLAPDFWVQTVAPNKEKIKREIEAGKEVPGAELIYGEHLRIGLT